MAWPGLRDSERDRDSEFGATAAGPGHPDRRALGRRAARARHVAGAADDTDSRLVYCRSIRRSTRRGRSRLGPGPADRDSDERIVTRDLVIRRCSSDSVLTGALGRGEATEGAPPGRPGLPAAAPSHESNARPPSRASLPVSPPAWALSDSVSP